MATSKKKPTSRSRGEDILTAEEKAWIAAPLKDAGTQRPVVLGDDREMEMVRRMGPLDVQEVHAILDSCRRNDVLKFSFRGLELSFQPKVAPVVEAHAYDGREIEVPAGAQPSHHTREQLEEARGRLRELSRSGASSTESVEALGERDFENVDNELEMLKITDPVAYEAAMNESPEFQDAKPG